MDQRPDDNEDVEGCGQHVSDRTDGHRTTPKSPERGVPDAPRDASGHPVAGGYLLSERAVSVLTESDRAGREPMAGVRDNGGRVQVQELDGYLPCHGGQDRLQEADRRML